MTESLDDHEARLMRELPERVNLDSWRLKLWAVLGSESRARWAIDLAERTRGALTLEESLTLIHRAAVMGWLPALPFTDGGSVYGRRTLAGEMRSLARAGRVLAAEVAAALRLRRWRKHPPGWYVLR